jgi:SOS-response transcriptional repressor LexA
MGWATKHIEELRLGKRVRCRPKGNSMVPKIGSGDLVIIDPLKKTQNPEVGDIVLCKVKGQQFLHLITAIRGDQYQISNNHGFINGWCGRAQIFGKVVSVSK